MQITTLEDRLLHRLLRGNPNKHSERDDELPSLDSHLTLQGNSDVRLDIRKPTNST